MHTLTVKCIEYRTVSFAKIKILIENFKKNMSPMAKTKKHCNVLFPQILLPVMGQLDWGYARMQFYLVSRNRYGFTQADGQIGTNFESNLALVVSYHSQNSN